MSYQRTQIYLDPDDHRRLRGEAARRGMSLTGLLRDIVADHVRERVAPYRPVSFDSVVGIADGPATDVAHDEDEMIAAAYEERLLRKLGGSRRRSSKASTRARRR